MEYSNQYNLSSSLAGEARPFNPSKIQQDHPEIDYLIQQQVQTSNDPVKNETKNKLMEELDSLSIKINNIEQKISKG